MKLKSIVIFISFLLPLFLLSSCFKTEYDDREEAAYFFTPRGCKYVFVNHFVEEPDKHFPKYIIQTPVESGVKVNLAKYVLNINTSNIEKEEFLKSDYSKKFKGEELNLPFYTYLFQYKKDKSDPIIEENLKKFYESRTKSSVLTRAYEVDVNYRLTPIKRLIIKCNHEINGIKPGESVNELFKIESYALSCIITHYKKIIAKDISDISIDKYLSYSPMAPVELRLRFNDNVKISKPMNVSFEVIIETFKGDIIETISQPVDLVP